MYTRSSLSIVGHLGCFHILAIVHNAAMNIEVHESFQISVFFSPNIYPRVEFLGHMLVLFFSYLRNLHTVFHTACINLHSHQLCTRVPFSSHLRQHLLFMFILVIAVLTGAGWYLIVVLNLHFCDD